LSRWKTATEIPGGRRYLNSRRHDEMLIASGRRADRCNENDTVAKTRFALATIDRLLTAQVAVTVGADQFDPSVLMLDGFYSANPQAERDPPATRSEATAITRQIEARPVIRIGTAFPKAALKTKTDAAQQTATAAGLRHGHH